MDTNKFIWCAGVVAGIARPAINIEEHTAMSTVMRQETPVRLALKIIESLGTL